MVEATTRLGGVVDEPGAADVERGPGVVETAAQQLVPGITGGNIQALQVDRDAFTDVDNAPVVFTGQDGGARKRLTNFIGIDLIITAQNGDVLLSTSVCRNVSEPTVRVTTSL
jgi:hypothetical protein